MDDDDDIPRLPADTLKALQDFQTEKDAREKQFEALRAQSESRFDSSPSAGGPNSSSSLSTTRLSMDLFGEDWNASQFWYTDATAETLARQLLAPFPSSSSSSSSSPPRIALISAPSIYIALHNLLLPSSAAVPSPSPSSPSPVSLPPRPSISLLEFDPRFSLLGPSFVQYDFRSPLSLPDSLRGKFDVIVCDPPFLSEDCQAKTALTARALARDWSPSGVRVVVCTGERMGPTIRRLYAGVRVRTTTFEPEHAKGRLGNEFRCYANFEGEGEGEGGGWREEGGGEGEGHGGV